MLFEVIGRGRRTRPARARHGHADVTAGAVVRGPGRPVGQRVFLLHVQRELAIERLQFRSARGVIELTARGFGNPLELPFVIAFPGCFGGRLSAQADCIDGNLRGLRGLDRFVERVLAAAAHQALHDILAAVNAVAQQDDAAPPGQLFNKADRVVDAVVPGGAFAQLDAVDRPVQPGLVAAERLERLHLVVEPDDRSPVLFADQVDEGPSRLLRARQLALHAHAAAAVHGEHRGDRRVLAGREAGDLHRLTVFGQAELVLLEPADDVTAGIEHADVDGHFRICRGVDLGDLGSHLLLGHAGLGGHTRQGSHKEQHGQDQPDGSARSPIAHPATSSIKVSVHRRLLHRARRTSTRVLPSCRTEPVRSSMAAPGGRRWLSTMMPPPRSSANSLPLDP